MRSLSSTLSLYASAVALGLMLSACSSNDAAPGVTVTGTVAVGAAVSGSTVSAKCRAGSTFTTVTSANGQYGLVIPAADLPCALRASGSLPSGTAALHSFVSAVGTANITPLTDLALAAQVNTTTGQTLANWFSNPGATTSWWTSISTALGARLDSLRTALSTAGYTLPTGWTAGSLAPFIAAFVANPAVDAYDRLLEALAQAIANSTTYADYAALLAAYTGGSTLPDAPEEATPVDPDPTDPPVGEPMTASLQAITANSITIRVSGTLGGTDPTFDRNSLYIHTTGDWISYSSNPQDSPVFSSALSGSPITGKTPALVTAKGKAQAGEFQAHMQINFGASNLTSGTDTGSDTNFTITFPSNVINTSLAQNLSLSWGSTTIPQGSFGPLQATISDAR